MSTSGGYAEFTDLKTNRLGNDYQLVASSNGYDSVESQPFAMAGLGQVTTSGMNGFTAINAKDRYAVGASGDIIASNDGGRTWRMQDSPVSTDLNAVDFLTRHWGFAVGEGGVFLLTKNGGLTWSKRSIGTSVNLKSVHFYNPRRGIIVGEGGFTARSTNRGLSWSIVSSGVSENLNSVSFSSAKKAVAVGQNGRVMTTSNGGRSWVQRQSVANNRLRSIRMQRGTRRGWAVGSNAMMMRTTDGGETWTQKVVSSQTDKDLNDVDFLDSNIGVAVGDGGTVLKTDDGGETWTGNAAGALSSLSADLRAVGFSGKYGSRRSGSSGSGRSIGKMSGDYSGGIAGSEGSVLASNNSGTTWVSQNGVYWSDTTWSNSESPNINIVGDIQIPSGVKLTIESGVVVQFEGAYEILVKGLVAVNGTEAQPVIFQSPTEGTSSEATVFHFKETDLSLSSMSHVKFSDSTYAIRIGGESNFNTLDIDTVEIKNSEVRADTHNVTQKASGGDSSKAKGKVVLDNVTLDTATIRTSYPWSEEIDVKNGTAVDSLMYVSDYGGKLTTENMTVSNSKYYIGCCDSYLDIKNSTLLASSLNGRNGTTLIQNSRLIGTPIRLNENYGSLTIEDSVIEYNTESRTFQGGWDSSSYAGEYGIKAGTTIDIKRSTIRGPGSGIGVDVQSSISTRHKLSTDSVIHVARRRRYR